MAQLQRERRSSERVYSYVREKLQETRMSLESEVGYAEVIRAAGPGYPLSPGWKKNLLLGMMLGLVAGGGIVVLRDQLDTSIREPDDLHDHGHRLAGVVPSMDELIEKDFGGERTIEIDGQQIQTSLVMLTSPMSAVAEAYRRIRTNLQFSRPDRELRTLAVSSADKGEGKTTTSANLAFALASAGKRTLLVDADLRRPRLHELLDLPREPGLSQLLYDDSRSLDRFSATLNDLHVVPGGEDVPNPAELMGSQRMGELVEELQQQFDYVIFDTPPVLLFSDALGLASQCDGTLLVASADSTDGRAFDHAVELLHDVEADVLGAILNRYDASSFLQGYGQYNYGYAHSYRRLEEHYAEPASKSGIRGWFTR
jgi:capsular exopolysaccharide synthesis family protein